MAQNSESKFFSIAGTNIRINSIKEYGISYEYVNSYFIKVKEFISSEKKKFLFLSMILTIMNIGI